MLKQRVVTAVILIGTLLLLLFGLKPFWFTVVLNLVVMAAAWEWAGLARLESAIARSAFCIVSMALIALLGYWLQLLPSGGFDAVHARQLCIAAVVIWGFNFLWIQGYPASALLWGRTPVLVILGLLLIASTWGVLATLLQIDNGQWLFLLLVTIIAAADIGGYFAGKAFGKHKMSPVISPNKTWEGLIGGLLAQMIPIGLVIAVSSTGVSLLSMLIVVVPVALFSVIGDLFESMVKRFRGVKDSGDLLPGHGGVLDRVDGFLAAAPMFTLMILSKSPF